MFNTFFPEGAKIFPGGRTLSCDPRVTGLDRPQSTNITLATSRTEMYQQRRTPCRAETGRRQKRIKRWRLYSMSLVQSFETFVIPQRNYDPIVAFAERRCFLSANVFDSETCMRW